MRSCCLCDVWACEAPCAWSVASNHSLTGRRRWCHSLWPQCTPPIVTHPVPASQAPLRLKREYSRHSKGVFCSAWSNHFNFLATGGMDRVVLLWTPYNKEPLAALTGHNMTITNLLINDRDAQILSLRRATKRWGDRARGAPHACSSPVGVLFARCMLRISGTQSVDPFSSSSFAARTR